MTLSNRKGRGAADRAGRYLNGVLRGCARRRSLPSLINDATWRPVVNDEQLTLLRLLVDRRRSLGEDHTRMVSQLHQLLKLIPGGAKKSLSAAQAKALLATVRPGDVVGKARRRVAVEISDLERVYQRSKEADKELIELVASTGTTLMDLHGIGPSGAAGSPAPAIDRSTGCCTSCGHGPAA